MSRTRVRYFLSAFVLIIGCFALNKSYSLFVDTKEKQVVSSTVPALSGDLSLASVTVEGTEEGSTEPTTVLVKQTVTNTGNATMNYAINAHSASTYSLRSTPTYQVSAATDGTNTYYSTGTLPAGESKDLYFAIENTSTDPVALNFSIEKNYDTISEELETNINNDEPYMVNVGIPDLPYVDKPNTLAAYIIKNDVALKGIANSIEELFLNDSIVTLNTSTELFPSPTEFTGVETNEVGLYKTEDDYGTSYYFRGASSINYVNFADMCWRIVRIDGNENIKLILEDQDETCSSSMNGNWALLNSYYGYTEYREGTLVASDGISKNLVYTNMIDFLHAQTYVERSLATSLKNFQSEFTNAELSKLTVGNWCLDDIAYNSSNDILSEVQATDNKINSISFNYGSYQRINGEYGLRPSFKCTGTIMNNWDDASNPTPMYVGAVTADEVIYAGGTSKAINNSFYLINEDFKKNQSGDNATFGFWTLSPSEFKESGSGYSDHIFSVAYSGGVMSVQVNMSFISSRPVVYIASGVEVDTNSENLGTIDKPYVIAS